MAKIITFLLLMIIGSVAIDAQNNTTSTGGVATGTGGTVSYSIGQIVYTTNFGATGSVADGVQDAYTISSFSGLADTTIQLEINLYPNPTTNFLSLRIENYQNVNFSFQLLDFQGKVLENKSINTIITTITMEDLPKATYLLKVTDGSDAIKTFKIIKN